MMSEYCMATRKNGTKRKQQTPPPDDSPEQIECPGVIVGRMGGGGLAMHEIAQLKEDIQEIKVDLRGISETLQALAVQEQRINALAEGVVQVRGDITSLYSWITKLQQDHDRCAIGTVSAHLGWIKWFVMGNTMANLAMLIGLVAHFLKAAPTP